MTLYLIGLGLYDEKDITLRGLEAIKKCSQVFLEYYTSRLACDVEKLEELYGVKIKIADRDLVEKKAEKEIIEPAIDGNVAFLIIGDPFAATTHIDIRLRAKEHDVDVVVIHTSSIITAIGEVGLELYKYGKITSIPFENDNITTPINVLKANQEAGLHTLFLLDLDPLKNKFMSIGEAATYLKRKGVDENILCIGCAGIGSQKAQVKIRKLKDMVNEPFTRYPQCMIIPGNLHFMEEEALESWR
jgi:diphthine synthase